MSYMLDTNTCIFAIKNKANVLSAIESHEPGGLFISTIVLSELEHGVCNSVNQEQNRIALIKFLAIIDLLAYDDRAAQEYGRLRTDLQRRGCMIGNMDMLIAAHAKSIGMTLVTNNAREFGRVRGLKIEDWS